MDVTVEKSLRGAALWDEVKDRLDSSAMGLSGGQQQRLCIARPIAIRPEIILMDEPAPALDPVATAKIEELILELKSQFAIVIVTHNMQQATRISDETAFFYLGELIEFAPTGKIFTDPSRKGTSRRKSCIFTRPLTSGIPAREIIKWTARKRNHPAIA